MVAVRGHFSRHRIAIHREMPTMLRHRHMAFLRTAGKIKLTPICMVRLRRAKEGSLQTRGGYEIMSVRFASIATNYLDRTGDRVGSPSDKEHRSS